MTSAETPTLLTLFFVPLHSVFRKGEDNNEKGGRVLYCASGFMAQFSTSGKVPVSLINFLELYVAELNLF